MSIPDTIRGVIAGPVKNILGPMRATIQVRPRIGRSVSGPVYGDLYTTQALVEQTSEEVTGADGTTHVSTAKFTFFEQLEINEGDRIILNGVETAVIKVGGLLDEKGKPYLPEAWTGK